MNETMITLHIAALSLTFTIYLSLAVAYFGWGKATAFLLGLRGQKNHCITQFIWLGWAFTLLIFQLIHFFLPLTAVAIIPVLIIGVALAIPQIASAYELAINHPSRRKILKISVAATVFVAVSVYVASRSMLPPANYDSGLYHLNKIRWLNTFPIVPGLGNLHGRLAFNQSFFAYVAALNFYPFFGHGRSIANSFLLLLAVATIIEFLWPAIKQPSFLLESHPFQYLSAIIALPFLAYLAIASNGLASPTPDLTSTLLQITMIVVLARWLEGWENGENFRAIFLAVLAITAVTIKLSNLAFSAVILGFVFFYAWKSNAKLVAARVIALSIIVILVWTLQSIILSGAPFFPSTIGYLPLEWAVPKERVINEANWIYSWARQPRTHWSNVLGNWNWLRPWVVGLFSTRVNYINVFFPLFIAGLFCIMILTIHRFKKGKRLQFRELAILLPAIIGLIYWFFTAPSPKFANALFFMIAMCAILLFFSSVQSMINKRLFFIIICSVLLFTNINFASYIVIKREDVKSISVSGWYPVESTPLDEKITLSGLSVYTPRSGDQTWDSPLPSTPYFNEHLRLRDSERMSSGFTMNGGDE